MLYTTYGQNDMRQAIKGIMGYIKLYTNDEYPEENLTPEQVTLLQDAVDSLDEYLKTEGGC